MAGEDNVGSIVFEVGLETTAMLSGGKQVNKVLSEIEASLDASINNFKKMDTQVSATAQAVSQSTRSFGGLQNAMRQGGYQIQDFVVQVQGGQSALVALSQQGSQLLGVFGAGGAVAGALLTIGTVIVGSLIAGMDNAALSTKALTEAQKRLADIFQVSSNGVVVLSDKFAKLAEVSENAARAQLTMALIDAQNVIKASVQSVNDLGDALGTWKAPLSAAISQMDALKEKGLDVKGSLDELGGTYEGNIVGLNQLNQVVTGVSKAFGISADDAIKLVQALADVRQNANPDTIAALRDTTVDLSQKYGFANKALSEFTGKVGEYSIKSDQAAESTRLATEMLNGHKVASQSDADAVAQNTKALETYIQMIKDEGATIAFTARQKALYRAEQLGASKEDKDAINTSFDKIEAFKSEQAVKKAAAKETTKTATASASAAKREVAQQESVAQKLANLKQQSELAADSTNNLSREQAILNAQLSLGKGATQEQIALAGKYAAAKWDTANALKAQAAAEKLLPESRESATYKQDVQDLNTALAAKKISQEQYNETSERLEQTHMAALAKIRADQAVTSVQEAAGAVDPVQALANQHAKQIALIQQYEQQGVLTHQNALAQRNAADTLYEQQRINAQWEIWKNQDISNQMLAASFESLAGNASNAFTGIITDSMSAQEAMQSLASNALNSMINGFVQMGVEWVKSAITGSAAQISATAATTSASVAGIATTTAASTASAATTTASWLPAAAAASIGSFGGAAVIGIGALVAGMALANGLAGKRKNGGPVSAGSMYQVGEGGMPEIYQASNGSQYMIPGDNGSVISNKDMQGGGGQMAVNIVFNDYSSSQHSFDAQASQDGNTLTVQAFIQDMDQGGPMRQSITRNTSATPRATE
ncbi:phage tail tape measure protein [Scandinavium manionii]|uniref:phage tail tape measure protein n=1 Tax=Scandinavium manionii TaxID=2926520 RepID=UPI0021666F45|nr:hypothetical protein [Scandinavium manionii]MCS2167533.1 hypothetical protein [Scandinavium manionii]